MSLFKHLVILFLFAIGACAPTSDNNVAALTDTSPLVVVVEGQSNASGRGAVTQLPAGFNDLDSEIELLNNSWVFGPAAEPIDAPVGSYETTMNDNAAGVGPGLAFAHRIREVCPDSSVVLAPCSMGGTTSLQWQRPANLSQAGQFFSICLRKSFYALAHTPGSSFAMIWYQGEANAHDPTLATNYKTHTEQFFTDMRAELGQNFPILMARLHATNPNATFYTYWNAIRNDEVTIATEVENVHLVEAAGALNSDHIHLATSTSVRRSWTYATYFSGHGSSMSYV